VAKAGDEIVNPRTGQRMVFLKTGTQTGGELLRIDSYNPPSPPLESEHVHPSQKSGAEVISGSLRFRVSGEGLKISVYSSFRSGWRSQAIYLVGSSGLPYPSRSGSISKFVERRRERPGCSPG
jgi:hypothetical protein